MASEYLRKLGRVLPWALLGGFFALLIFLPLKWVGPKILPVNMTSAETQYSGSIWKGRVSQLKDLDSVDFTLKPLNVLRGERPATFVAKATGLNVSGSAGKRQAQDISFAINMASLPLPDPRLKGLAGMATARIENVEWNDLGACESITGRAQSDILQSNQGLFNWSGPVISGPIRCDDTGAYVFTLTGKDQTQSIETLITISASGSYQADINVTTRDQNAALALPLFGFEEKSRNSAGRQFVLIEQGQWR